MTVSTVNRGLPGEIRWPAVNPVGRQVCLHSLVAVNRSGLAFNARSKLSNPSRICMALLGRTAEDVAP